MGAAYLRPVLLLAGILSLVQSIVWFIMSLLGILAYRCELGTPEESDKIARLMFYLYFQGHECAVPDSEIDGALNTNGLSMKKNMYATPDMINSWMASYLAFDITYMFLSVALLVGYCRMKEGGPPNTTIRIWCLNTLVFLILDLWLTIIWGVDFRNITNFISDHNIEDSYGWAPSVPGALMAVTARGFILYVINLTLFIYLVKNSIPWSHIFRCWAMGPSSNQGQKGQQLQFNIPRVSTTEPWNNGQVLVPYHQSPARGYTNEGYAHDISGRYPPKHWEYGRRRSEENIVHAPISYDRGYPYQQDPTDHRDRDEDYDMGQEIPHSSRQEPSFPVRGRPTTRTTVLDNKDRKNFQQGHGSPSKPHGPSMKVPPGARNNDYFY